MNSLNLESVPGCDDLSPALIKAASQPFEHTSCYFNGPVLRFVLFPSPGKRQMWSL